MDNFDEILDSLENEKRWVIFVRQSHQKATEGQYRLSIELAQKALELNPRSSEAYCLIGNAYEKLAEEQETKINHAQARTFYNKAKDAWNKAKEIKPDIVMPDSDDYN
ncbi:MAG: hypothetical protein JW928_02305 [Candidatus Aureabacteria bacterium]|nr:hypothetical protein [Candidatus Auribacterota bacterium]